jgi:signal transduction histidine kinase
LAVENERLGAEVRTQLEAVRASRARLVEAQDTERRRIERDLHDGAQQRLVALSVSLRLAESRLSTDPEAARPILTAARDELAHALEELRELARGIHPAVLTDSGLVAAVDGLVGRSPVPIRAEVCEERLAPAIEAAAYYVISESLANVTKYAQAQSVDVSVVVENGLLTVSVSDDGIGGADPSRGSGLRGLEDRVAAIGGSVVVESPAGGGTRVVAEIPLLG